MSLWICLPTMYVGHHTLFLPRISEPTLCLFCSFSFNIIVFSNANLFTQDRRGTAVDKNTFVLQRTGRFPGHPWLPKVSNH